jgi:hypothetical protein
MDKGTDADAAQSKLQQPFTAPAIRLQSAKDAFVSVLEKVGANLPKRDSLDERILNDVRNRIGRFVDVQGGFPHGTAYQLTVNAWPTLQSTTAPKDSDLDGMPDEWESRYGLNPADPSDAAGYKLSKVFTNVEVYLNGLVK